MVVLSQGLRLRIASLFAGAGGLDLGFRGGFSHLGVFYERLLSRTCAKVHTVLFLPRRVLLTPFVSDRRDFPAYGIDALCRSAAVTGRTRHG